MYTAPQKKFRARDEAEVLDEIRRCGEQLIVQRVFLADGDALVLPTHGDFQGSCRVSVSRCL